MFGACSFSQLSILILLVVGFGCERPKAPPTEKRPAPTRRWPGHRRRDRGDQPAARLRTPRSADLQVTQSVESHKATWTLRAVPASTRPAVIATRGKACSSGPPPKVSRKSQNPPMSVAITAAESLTRLMVHLPPGKTIGSDPVPPLGWHAVVAGNASTTTGLPHESLTFFLYGLAKRAARVSCAGACVRPCSLVKD